MDNIDVKRINDFNKTPEGISEIEEIRKRFGFMSEEEEKRVEIEKTEKARLKNISDLEILNKRPFGHKFIVLLFKLFQGDISRQEDDLLWKCIEQAISCVNKVNNLPKK